MVKNLAILFCLSLLFFSCERVVSVDIDNVTPQFVVEGVVNDDGICRVRLSRTINYFDTSKFVGVANAKVTISENGNTPFVLFPTSSVGEYTAQFSGSPGRTYTLRVEYAASAGGTPKIFTATSVMPKKVTLDSLYITDRVFLGKMRKIATIKFKDPPEWGNTYRFVQYVDGKEDLTIFVTRDDLINGRTVVDELLIFDENYTLKKCDQLRVQLRCIDPPNYLFWYSLNQSALGTSQSATPANPASNINGGALGYFSAHTVSSKNIAVSPDASCSFPN